MENLVKNSAEAMPNGGEIRLDWLYDTTAHVLLVEVSDNGPGIDPLLLKKLISGEAVRSSKSGGSGLGMSTVVGVLDRLGGQIGAASKVGQGTTWTLSIPAAIESALETQEPE